MSRRLPEGTALAGNADLLQLRTLAFFCSRSCPGELILRTYDWARNLRDPELAVVGGFHSPMEQETLRLLLRNRQPVIVCPARSIERMRVPAERREALDAGRLLLLSPFTAARRRGTAETAARRNALVATLADKIFVAYAAPGSRTEAMCRDMLAEGRPVWTLDSAHNAGLLGLGALPLPSATSQSAADGQ